MKHFKILLFSVVASVFLIGCKLTQDYKTPEIPQNISENLYGENTSKDSVTIAKVSWKEIFTDSKLQNLIHKSLENNLDLKVAIERINQADAVFKQSQLTTLPTLNGNLGASVTKNSDAAQNFVHYNAVPNFQLGISAGWQADLWGKIASAKRYAYANFLQTDAAKRAIETQIVSQTSQYYYQLLALDKQIEITKNTIELRKKNLETVKLLMQGAYLTGADIAQSESNLYSTQASLPDLELQVNQTENALSLLIGNTPSHIERNTLEVQNIYKDFQTGVPAQLLKYRPDVQAAELAFRATFESKNIALASLYPTLSLSASVALSTQHLSDFFTKSLYYSLASSLTQPIFQQGSLKANIKIAEAQKQQAFYTFQNTLLTAGSEVSNAMYKYNTALEKEKYRKLQIQSLEKAVDFSNELLVYSSNYNYINVLTAEQSLLAAQLTAVNDRLQQLVSVSEFYAALGGGQN